MEGGGGNASEGEEKRQLGLRNKVAPGEGPGAKSGLR